VLMDLPRLWGMRYLPSAKAIYAEDLDAWEKKAGVKVGSGDVILIYTGRWARRAAEGQWKIMQGSAGLHVSAMPWLKQRDVAILGSDLSADVLPSGVEGVALPVHAISIASMGVPILDNLDLEAVSEACASRKRWDFLLTAAPLAVDGGTGSPINPVAIF
jgi:kynurenine formamidase